MISEILKVKDRNVKPRVILLDENLLYQKTTKFFAMELIDIAELSPYLNCIVLSDKDVLKTQEFLEHNCLSAKVELKYRNYQQLRKQHKFLVAFCDRSDQAGFKNYYRCEVLSR